MSKQEVKRSLKKIVLLAKRYLEPDTSTIEGLKQFLKTWYVIKFNTTYKDPILLEHTFEELLLLFYVHSINQDPTVADSVLNSEDGDSFEKWLQEAMGDDYVTEEGMAEDMVEYSNKEKELASQLPDRIDTDFSSIDVGDK